MELGRTWGRLLKPPKFAKEEKKEKESENALNDLLGELGIEGIKKSQKEEQEEKVETIFVFTTNEKIFNIFKLCVRFFREGYAVPEQILLRLLDEANLPIAENLTKFITLRDGFIEGYEDG